MITLAHSCIVAAALLACVSAQRFGYDSAPAQVEERAPRYIASASDPKPTPVPILKQINRHNEDGSYTYGYEGADGSFKIETKLANGEVKGKYGYKDDTGKVRTIEYGANKYGFQPSGEGITVAPPTLVDESAQEEKRSNQQNQQFPSGGGSQYNRPAPAQQPDYDYEEPAPAPAPAPYRAPQHVYRASAPPALRPPKPAFFAGAAPAPAPVAPQRDQYFSPTPQGVTYAQPAAQAQKAQYQYSQNIDYSNQFQPQQQQYSAPAPRKHYEAQQFASPALAPAPAPVQQYNQAPLFQPKQPKSFDQQQQQPYSMLDQLIKEFGLPQGGSAPYHDITFGSNYN